VERASIADSKTATYMVLEEIIDSNIKEVSYDTKHLGGKLKRKQ